MSGTSMLAGVVPAISKRAVAILSKQHRGFPSLFSPLRLVPPLSPSTSSSLPVYTHPFLSNSSHCLLLSLSTSCPPAQCFLTSLSMQLL